MNTDMDIESASDKSQNQVRPQPFTSSFQTTNQLSSNQTIDLPAINHKVSEDNQIPETQSLTKNQIKNETKIYLECRLNHTMIEPMGLFSDKEIRNAFIRKVYSLLFVQILFTIIVSGVMFTFLRDWLNFEQIQKRKDGLAMGVVIAILIGSWITILVITIIFCCSMSARRTVPINFILMGLFTIAETLMVGIICVQNNGEHIIMAFVLTGIVVLAITLLATTPWFDITNCGCLLCFLFLLYMFMGIVVYAIILFTDINVKPLYIGLSIFGAFLFSLYLLYDTQLILGGKKYAISPEEYIFATICLYVDIIQIFLHILDAIRTIDS